MTKITSFLSKALLIVTLAVMALAGLPAGTVFAAGLQDDPQPGRGRDYIPRLERIFEHQQDRYDHQTQLLERVPTFIDRIQSLIDRATEKGYDPSAVQAALDAFSAAIPAAQAAHDQAGALIAAHAGFDDKGKVTDARTALQTVKDVHDAFRTFVDTLLPQFISLRQAIHAFIDKNNLRGQLRPEATAAP
jgi:hypothetical protein